MRKDYKPFPVDEADPTTRGERFAYWPVLQVRMGCKHARSPRFDAVVDSGSMWCLFRSDLGRMVGIDIEKGERYPLGGIIANLTKPAYFHKVKLYIEPEWMIETMAGFCDDLAVTGVLGRCGFFTNFKTTFDHSGIVPALEVERVHRA